MTRQSQRLLFAGCATALALAAVPASARQAGADGDGCRLMVEAGPSQWVLDYDPFVDATASRAFDIAVVNRGAGPCTAVAGVDLRGEAFGLAPEGGGARLPYSLIDERAGTDLTPRTGETARRASTRPVHLGPGERALLRFSINVASPELLSAGLFSQAISVTLERPDGIPLAERPVTLGVRVASAAMMGLKGEFQRRRGMATIDLGVLTEGARPLNATLYVLSTSSYRVSVSSANAGRLRRGSSDWYVPYSLMVGDRAVDLASSRDIEVSASRARSDQYPLAIDVPSVSGRRAGDYTDVVTFTVAAL